jgi:hypothetical protein
LILPIQKKEDSMSAKCVLSIVARILLVVLLSACGAASPSLPPTVASTTTPEPTAIPSATSTPLQFLVPSGLFVDSEGKIYVGDTGNNRIVRFDDMTGTNWVTYGSRGTEVGQQESLWTQMEKSILPTGLIAALCAWMT